MLPNSAIIQFCCFKPPGGWYFVTGALGSPSNGINFNCVPTNGDEPGLPSQCSFHLLPTVLGAGVTVAIPCCRAPWPQLSMVSASPSSTCLNQPVARIQGDRGVSSWQRHGRQLAGVPRPPPLPCPPRSALPMPHVADVLLVDSRRGEGQRGRPSRTSPTSCVQVAHDSGRQRPAELRGITHGPIPLPQQPPHKEPLNPAVAKPGSGRQTLIHVA